MARIVTIPYKPRDIFKSYHQSLKRYSLTVAHRRAGKTVARINKLIKAALTCERTNPRFGYLSPFYVQSKDIAWAYIKHYCAPLIDLGAKVNESELSITLPHNNAIIKLYGAENAERMRGLYFDGLVVDEGQGINRAALTQIILPSLADRKGWLDVSGTPKGWSNLLGELYKLAQDNDDWFCQVLRASETGILPGSELANLRTLMSDNEYDQELECSFDAAITGAVYGKWMAEVDKAGRIGNVTYDTMFPVYTAWDLGFDDATSIVFYQVGNGEIFIIDYYENNGEGIGHYCDMLKEKDYNYHTHYVPHDALNKVMAAGGRSIVEQAKKDHGITMVSIPATSEQNGIEALRATLNRCWFRAETCQLLIDALRQYQYKYDNERKIYMSKPMHDWSSHACDAMELMARMWREKAMTSQQLEHNRLEADFFRKRKLMNNPTDPYRVKPKMGKK